MVIYYLCTIERYYFLTGSALVKLPGVQTPSTKLLNIIDTAADMPTTLWFSQDSQLDNLIISGQSTICYNLMVYITRNYGNDTSSFPDEIKNIWNKLVIDWDKFCSEPQSFL